MQSFLAHWAASAVALAVTAWLLPGVAVSSLAALLVAALVLGLLNAVVKPVLVLLTLPLTILTLGIFYLILNGVMFALASVLVPGFQVAGFGAAFLGAIVMGLCSMMLAAVLRDDRSPSVRGT
ncbi:MAG TPA: phage holin family protein [bacterium]|nr:phage holin family protein [bacterium]